MPVLKINASIFSFQAAVLPESFRNGKMRLECTATIFNVYNRTTKAIIEEENPRAALVLSTTQDSASSTSKHQNHFMLSPLRSRLLSRSPPSGAGNVRNVYLLRLQAWRSESTAHTVWKISGYFVWGFERLLQIICSIRELTLVLLLKHLRLACGRSLNSYIEKNNNIALWSETHEIQIVSVKCYEGF